MDKIPLGEKYETKYDTELGSSEWFTDGTVEDKLEGLLFGVSFGVVNVIEIGTNEYIDIRFWDRKLLG